MEASWLLVSTGANNWNRRGRRGVGREAVRRRTNSRFGSNGRVPRLLPERRSWRNRRLQPKTAFLRFAPVRRADLVGQQSRRQMTAICAKQRFCEGVRFGDLMQRLLGDAAACDRLFQRIVEAAVEAANKAGEKQEE